MRFTISGWMFLLVAALAGCHEPARLRVVADVPGLGIWDLAAQGQFVYAADGNRGLVILDVSDPLQPDVVGELLPSGSAGGGSVAVAGNTAYLTGTDNELAVIDISDPARPAEVGQVAGNLSEIAVQGDHVYGVSSDLYVFDVSVPSAPERVGDLDLNLIWDAIAVSNELAFLGDVNDGLYIIDVANPAQPVQVGRYPDHAVYALAARDELVYAAGPDGLAIIDVADPAQPRLRGHSELSCTLRINAITLVDQFAYVAGDDCLEGLDVSNTRSPRSIAILDAPIRISYWAVAVSGGYIFLGYTGALLILPEER